MKRLFYIILILASFSAQANECASSISELRDLVGNADLPVNWIEKGKDPLVLSVKNGGDKLALRIRKGSASWADVTGVICRKGKNYVAKVENISWGSAAPGVVKGVKIKEMSLKLPYHSQLKVSVSLLSFEFTPL